MVFILTNCILILSFLRQRAIKWVMNNVVTLFLSKVNSAEELTELIDYFKKKKRF